MRKSFLLVLLIVPLIGHTQDTNLPFVMVEVMPQPIGEDVSIFSDWLNKQSRELKNKYSINCDSSESKLIYISFIIDKSGNVLNPFVLKGVEPEINKEAVQLVRNMNIKWKPGTNRGKNVSTKINAVFHLCPIKEYYNKKKNKKDKKK
ncbi:MAG: energy transducer TonB [Bacteroidales bacterium]|nr:energy transducer TonB [Bacteroidales bacterium]